MKKALTIIIIVLVFAGVIAAAIFVSNSKKIPDNPSGTVGNSSGNLNNLGLFCESDGVIYFSNVNDSHCLYSMSPKGANVTKIMDVPAAYISVAGDYIYFYYADQGDAKFMGVAGNMRGIYRIDKKGKDELACLERATSAVANLIDNKVYYEHYDNVDGMTLYYTSTDGKDKGLLVNEIINPACVLSGHILYPDQNNSFALMDYNPANNSSRLFSNEGMYNPTLNGQYIYYMNINDDYCLYRMNISTKSPEKITADRVDTFNVYGDRIFYQRNKKPCLISVNSDGSNLQVIAEGNFKNINCTSNYTFYQPFDDDETMYVIPTNGYGQSGLFVPTAN